MCHDTCVWKDLESGFIATMSLGGETWELMFVWQTSLPIELSHLPTSFPPILWQEQEFFS